jgi:hypothetical protein
LLYAHADTDLIPLIDDLFARGNLRNWAAFTDSALRLARDFDRSEVDERLTRNVFALHAWRGPLTAPSRWSSIPPTTSTRSPAYAACTQGRSAKSSASRRPEAAPTAWLGHSHGRAGQPAIRRRLAQLDAPASLWEHPPHTTIGDGPHADGRALLLRLSAWHLWLDRLDEPADSAPT